MLSKVEGTAAEAHSMFAVGPYLETTSHDGYLYRLTVGRGDIEIYRRGLGSDKWSSYSLNHWQLPTDIVRIHQKMIIDPNQMPMFQEDQTYGYSRYPKGEGQAYYFNHWTR